MRFRPCIDIHNGKVKQLVGGSLKDSGNTATENFVSDKAGAHYAEIYKKDGLTGGHVIVLNSQNSKYYEETKKQAINTLKAYPKGLQAGGGINPDNAMTFIDAGASHVIVTSYIFTDGKLDYNKLDKMVKAVGKERLVIDLSCRKRNKNYYVVTDRWQTFTDVILTSEKLEELSQYCDEFLIHGVDVEGKGSGMEEELIKILSEAKNAQITYAGGLSNMEHIKRFAEISGKKLDFTIGSALDIFGGDLLYDEVKNYQY